jgi:DNA-binding ferritin-like protein
MLRETRFPNRYFGRFGDRDTADLFTEVSRGVDYRRWLVESHLSRG